MIHKEVIELYEFLNALERATGGVVEQFDIDGYRKQCLHVYFKDDESGVKRKLELGKVVWGRRVEGLEYDLDTGHVSDSAVPWGDARVPYSMASVLSKDRKYEVIDVKGDGYSRRLEITYRA